MRGGGGNLHSHHEHFCAAAFVRTSVSGHWACPDLLVDADCRCLTWHRSAVRRAYRVQKCAARNRVRCVPCRRGCWCLSGARWCWLDKRRGVDGSDREPGRRNNLTQHSLAEAPLVSEMVWVGVGGPGCAAGATRERAQAGGGRSRARRRGGSTRELCVANVCDQPDCSHLIWIVVSNFGMNPYQVVHLRHAHAGRLRRCRRAF